MAINNTSIFESVDFLNESDYFFDMSFVEGAKFDLFNNRYSLEGEDYTKIKNLLNQTVKDSKMDKKYIQKHSRGIVYNIKRTLQVVCDVVGIGTNIATTSTSVDFIRKANSKSIHKVDILDKNGTPIELDFNRTLLQRKYINSILVFLITFLCSRIIRYCVDVAEFASIRKDAKEMVKILRDKAKDAKDEKIAAKMRDQADRIENELEKRQGWFDKQIESIENKFKKK